MHTIAIVDSAPLERLRFKRILEEEGYRIETASTRTTAQELLTRLGIQTSAIVMDWALPDTGGSELIAWIQAQPFVAGLEVITYSDVFSSEHVEQAIEAGAYYFLTKPFDARQLEAIVRAAVESVEQRRALERQAQETRDAVGLLVSGSFRVHTLEEAELLAVHLASACGNSALGLPIRELLVNAIEHGNLGITYDEKGRLLKDRALDAECRRRLRLPKYRKRHVEVALERRVQALSITIKDQGEGFDFETYMTIDQDRLFDLHGRGVLVASAALDLEYIPPGNQVKIRLPTEG